MNSFRRKCRLHVHVIISVSNDLVIRLRAAGIADATVLMAAAAESVAMLSFAARAVRSFIA